MMNSQRNILLVEDDRVDAMTVKRALNDINVTNHLDIVNNGIEALKYLKQNSSGGPCIILLDINMPKMDGIEFLQAATAEGLLDRIPVIVLTTSKDDEDKVNSFKFHVSGYMIKPVSYKKFVETMRAIDMYWTLSEFPE